ncbi:DUF2306 domain-containing protein [Agromyces bauzanensis]|uniref:DUF2306 domain-containing protein n=1 Tax=Agromyces bauzanensis TaxID=1308924 RepID=A0A917PLA8_9MICO|nr:DUF2306 domain-containing protein [Agromyces bauzanensis]GGJ82805.1 hypothetical protein GCM10011372_21370 [Agromyces bauzanensis]
MSESSVTRPSPIAHETGPRSTAPRPARSRPARAWLAVTGPLLLSLVPVVAGAARLTELSSGAAVTPDNARLFEAPVPVVLHIVGATVFSVLGAFQFVPSLRRRRWHRLAGRVVVPAGFVAALSGLWMSAFFRLPSIDGEAPGTDASTSVAVALAANPYLLVLDNVDRVGPAVGEIVARAQSVAPDLRVLTTSRTPIGDPAEGVFPLAPLTTEGPDAAAVAMFLDRLGAAGRAAAAPMTLSAAEPSPATSPPSTGPRPKAVTARSRPRSTGPGTCSATRNATCSAGSPHSPAPSTSTSQWRSRTRGPRACWFVSSTTPWSCRPAGGRADSGRSPSCASSCGREPIPP